jgi:hypothetical protein
VRRRGRLGNGPLIVRRLAGGQEVKRISSDGGCECARCWIWGGLARSLARAEIQFVSILGSSGERSCARARSRPRVGRQTIERASEAGPADGEVRVRTRVVFRGVGMAVAMSAASLARRVSQPALDISSSCEPSCSCFPAWLLGSWLPHGGPTRRCRRNGCASVSRGARSSSAATGSPGHALVRCVF